MKTGSRRETAWCTNLPVWLLATAFIATGCGGGGGGGQPDGTAPAATVTQAPRDEPVSQGATLPPSGKSAAPAEAGNAAEVVFVRIDPMVTHPVMHATDVPTATSIVVAYEGAIDQDKPLTATLENAQGMVEGDVAINAGSVIFMTRSPLAASTLYTFTLQVHVATVAGATSDKTKTSLEFRTAASI